MRSFKIKKILYKVAAVVLALSMMTVPVFADEQSDLENENEELKSQIADEEARVAELKSSVSELEDAIDAINEELDRIEGIIADYREQKSNKEAEVEALNEEIENLEGDIADKEAEISDEYELMKKRIKFLYENVGNNYIEAIFSSTSFSEAVQKIQYLLEITNYDRRIMKQVQEKVETVQNEKAELETQKETVEADIVSIGELEEAEAAQQELYEETKALKEDELDEAQYELNEAQATIDAFNAEIAKNQSEIDSLIAAYEAQLEAERQRKAEEEAARQAEEESRRLAEEEESRRAEEAGEEYESTEPEEDDDDDNYTDYGGGSEGYIWPLSGYSYITSYFGYRGDDEDLPEDSNLTYHYGIDIYAPSGTPIRAVADGVVVVSGWSDSIGWYMAIYHGNGVFSEMHHMSSKGLSVGTSVTQGQTVGYVGATGTYCYGAHLHFGICTGSDSWALANYVNPLNYIG